jgi:hypothetical protein
MTERNGTGRALEKSSSFFFCETKKKARRYYNGKGNQVWKLTVAKSLLTPKEDLTLSSLLCARFLYRRSPPATAPAPSRGCGHAPALPANARSRAPRSAAMEPQQQPLPLLASCMLAPGLSLLYSDDINGLRTSDSPSLLAHSLLKRQRFALAGRKWGSY